MSGAVGSFGASRQFRPGIWPLTLALAIGLLALGALFRVEVAAAVSVWRSSTAYNHCILVLPIALYIAWDLRGNLKGLAPQPLPLAALLAVPLMLLWLAAQQLGFMEGRQLMAIAIVELLFFCVLGWPLWRALAPAMLYLVFLVPFGAFITPVLQAFTARFVAVGLTLLQVPHYVDAFVIEIPEGRFIVADACAGLRFLIAAIAFGALYAILFYRSPLRRLAFLVASVIVPVLANGLRCLGLVLLGHELGSAQAVEADHILYGWIFFSIVLLILTVAGLPFRQDRAAPPTVARHAAPPGRLHNALAGTAAALLVLLAAAGPVMAHLLDNSDDLPVAAAVPKLTPPEGCTAPADGAAVNPAILPSQSVQHFSCGTQLLNFTVRIFPAGTLADALLAARRGIVVQDDDRDPTTSSLLLPGSDQPRWEIVQTGAPPRSTASALWIRGRPASGSLADRLDLAWDHVRGVQSRPILAFAEVVPQPGAEADLAKQKTLLESLVRSRPRLADEIAAAGRIQP